jgi:hypothetical protein
MIGNHWRFAMLLLSASLPASAAFAEESRPAEPPAAAACELHVWPGNDLRSTYHGWWHGGIVDGAVNGRDGYPALPKGPLSSARQKARLEGLDLASLLGLTGYRTVVHEVPLDSRVIRASATRYAPDTLPCYAELAIDDVFFQQDVIDGRFVKTLFRFRSYESGDAPKRSFGAYIQERLLQFPANKPEAAQASLDELADAFGKTVVQFGAALNKPPKSPRQKSRKVS